MHFDGTETAAEIEQALQELLFPITTPATGEARSCGSEGATRCSRSVFVYEYFNAAVNHGRDLLIGFRGERNAGVGAIPQIVVTGDSNDAAVAIELVRQDGINYYGLETLNIKLGHGSDVLNVRGTIPTTNLELGDGDDRVYVSHLADVGIDGRPDYLPGHLDLIEGQLNIAMGAGRHTLMISDEMASAGDTGVLITDVTPRNEILVRNLAPAEISYGAAPGGNFYDGITIWTGSGADQIAINGTHYRNSGLWTITALNTGLGNDTRDRGPQPGRRRLLRAPHAGRVRQPPAPHRRPAPRRPAAARGLGEGLRRRRPDRPEPLRRRLRHQHDRPVRLLRARPDRAGRVHPPVPRDRAGRRDHDAVRRRSATASPHSSTASPPPGRSTAPSSPSRPRPRRART